MKKCFLFCLFTFLTANALAEITYKDVMKHKHLIAWHLPFKAKDIQTTWKFDTKRRHLDLYSDISFRESSIFSSMKNVFRKSVLDKSKKSKTSFLLRCDLLEVQKTDSYTTQSLNSREFGKEYQIYQKRILRYNVMVLFHDGPQKEIMVFSDRNQMALLVYGEILTWLKKEGILTKSKKLVWKKSKEIQDTLKYM